MNKTQDLKEILKLYTGKRVLISGNTGFKGSWLTHILLSAGAEVIGYALKPSTEPNLFSMAFLESNTNLYQIYGDIRDFESLIVTFKAYKPEIVIHLAAQPIVRDSYYDPLTTYSTNVMGTVNMCEAVRLSTVAEVKGGIKDESYSGVKSFLNVTTDKVYKNFEWEYGYRENDPLDGYDPYSNSKSCSELVTHCYKNSFFKDGFAAISTARAGNVIGGGDFSKDRILPDSIKVMKNAVDEKKNSGEIRVRNPYSTRPYQHVLEPLFMYLTIAICQYEDKKFSGCYNVGPDDCDCVRTGDLVQLFCEKWNCGDDFPRALWEIATEKNAPHEASFLKLDTSRIKSVFGWKPRWHINKAVAETVRFSKVWMCGSDVKDEMDREIQEYLK